MFKDPLNYIPDAYDTLELTQSITPTDDDIELAFMNALKKGRSWEQVSQAKETLFNPAKLALQNIFNYDLKILKKLTPTPDTNPRILNPMNRTLTASSWEKNHMLTFPDYHLVHTLALLWYWLANYEETRLRYQLSKYIGTTNSNPEPFSVLFPNLGTSINSQNVAEKILTYRKISLSYWAMLLASGEFTHVFPQYITSEYKNLPTDIIQKLISELLEFPEKIRIYSAKLAEYLLYPNISNKTTIELFPNQIVHSLSQLYEGYKIEKEQFELELQTTKTMAEAHITIHQRPIACGKNLLIHLSLLKNVRTIIIGMLEQHPDSTRLQKLELELSPFSQIVNALNQNNAKLALELLKAQKANSQNKEELTILYSQAYFILGKNKITEKKEYIKAIELWEKALTPTLPHHRQLYLCENINNQCCEILEHISDSTLDDAIEVLSRMLRKVYNADIKYALAAYLTKRGEIYTNNLEEQINSGITLNSENVTKQVQKIVNDLEQAWHFKYHNAQEPLKKARRLLREAKCGLLGLPRKHRDRLKKAHQAIDDEKYKQAIALIKKLLADIKPSQQKPIKKLLANTMLEQAKKYYIQSKNKIGVNEQISNALLYKNKVSTFQIKLLKKGVKLVDEAEKIEYTLTKKCTILKEKIGTLIKTLTNTKQNQTQYSRNQQVTNQPLMNDLFKWFKFAFSLSLILVFLVVLLKEGWQILPFIVPLYFICRPLLKIL